MNLPARKARIQPIYPACPDCESRMRPYRCDEEIVFKCDHCHGVWLTGRRLGTFRNSLANFDLSALEVYWHEDLRGAYIISSCAHCRQVLDGFNYGYNSGVRIYRCSRCLGIWLPIKEVVRLIESLKLGQSLAEDVRGFLNEFRMIQSEAVRFRRFAQIMRSLVASRI